jgi:hypothetical protein
MDAETIFPVFSQLHEGASDMHLPALRPERKACANEAGLFVGGADATSDSGITRDEPETDLLKVTGDAPRDTVVALHCLAYLSEFFAAIEPKDLRNLADEVRRGDD